MKLPQLFKIDKYIKIPKVFYADSTGKPFERCLVCNKYLLKNGVQYVIEKVIKNYKKYNTYDTIFEYAMCIDCSEKKGQSFSEISMRNIFEYFIKNINLIKRRTELLKDGELDINKWISKCIIKGTPVNELSEYQIACQCDGNDLLFTYLPYMISSEAIDEIVELLSAKTLGEIEGFRDKFFDYPPELKPLFKDRPVFIF